MKPLAIIISTCNRPFLLRDLEGQVKEQMHKKDTIVVVNDGEKSSIPRDVNRKVEKIQHCKDYYAVASAKNAGMRRALSIGYEWGLLLDDDLDLSEDVITAHKKQPEDKNTVYVGKVVWEWGEKDVRKILWDGTGNFLVKWGGWNASAHLPSVLDADGFDERFDGHWGYEDNELYYRLRQKGWDFEYMEDTVIKNLEAPTDGNYQRGDTTNKKLFKELCSEEATY